MTATQFSTLLSRLDQIDSRLDGIVQRLDQHDRILEGIKRAMLAQA